MKPCTVKPTARKTVPALLLSAAIAGCTGIPSSTRLGEHPTWRQIPAWAQQRVQNPWWKSYRDNALAAEINTALANSPDLAVIAARLGRADAMLKKAGAAGLPRLGIGIGWRDGRKQEVNLGPYDLAPWEGGGQLSWEVDLTGKLLAATRSARYARDAAYWDVHAARLQLASRVASVHFLVNRLNGDLELMHAVTYVSRELTRVMRDQANAGIIAATRLSEQQAQHEQNVRAHEEIRRLRDTAIVQLRTLVGGKLAASHQGSTFLPRPAAAGGIPSDRLLASHPQLLAAEARVRSAFQLEKSARLNLLPSFRIGASAMGAGQSLTGRYRVWQHQAGPSLDIPIYDPTRLAQAKVRKAERTAAAAQYRAAVLSILGEIDTARISYHSRSRQLASAAREVAARERAYRDARGKRAAGVISDAAPLTARQAWLAARLKERALRLTLLNDHINLTKALGGAAHRL